VAYSVRLTTAAQRQFNALPRDVQGRIRPHIDSRAQNPRPSAAKKPSGPESIYRIRVGDYRILYQVRDADLVVLVLKTAHRKDAYRLK